MASPSLQGLCECSLPGIFLDPYGVTSQTGQDRQAASAVRAEQAKPRASVDRAVSQQGLCPASQSGNPQAASVMSQACEGRGGQCNKQKNPWPSEAYLLVRLNRQ